MHISWETLESTYTKTEIFAQNRVSLGGLPVPRSARIAVVL